MHYIGLMSGTSADGIDAVVVAIDGPGSLRVLASHNHPYPAPIRAQILDLTSITADAARTDGSEIERAAELDMALGELFADAANRVLAKSGLPAGQIRAIGSHGQTLRHGPRALHPYSLQIANPSMIAERTGITTVADFRARDMAAGGQGAPLVPAFHQWLFQRPAVARVIINIGGIANITYLPQAVHLPVTGFDTGPGNTLLDQWINKHQGHPFDRDGKWGASGNVSEPLLSIMLRDPYFSLAPPKSTGREYFHLPWLYRYLDACVGLSAADVQASLAALTTHSLAQAIQTIGRVDEVYVCGGGVHNRVLMQGLQGLLKPIPVANTESLGLHPDWVEAVAFAWLAHQTLEGRSGNLPSVTGASHAVTLGGIYQA